MNANAIRSTVLCLLLVATTSLAHEGVRIYPIYQIPPSHLPDLHDGTLEDWHTFLPGASVDHNEFLWQNAGNADPVDPADLAWQVFLGWSLEEQRIYIAVERFDDKHINDYDGGGVTQIWRHDGAQFLIDGDHSGGQFTGFPGEEGKALNNSQAQNYYMLPSSPDGQQILSDNVFQVWSVQSPWVDVGGFEIEAQPSVAGIEAAITPWDQLHFEDVDASSPSRLEAGQIVGFQMAIPDFDVADALWDGFYTIVGAFPLHVDASNFVDGELLQYTGDGWISAQDGTVVRQGSWARIKASLR